MSHEISYSSGWDRYNSETSCANKIDSTALLFTGSFAFKLSSAYVTIFSLHWRYTTPSSSKYCSKLKIDVSYNSSASDGAEKGRNVNASLCSLIRHRITSPERNLTAEEVIITQVECDYKKKEREAKSSWYSRQGGIVQQIKDLLWLFSVLVFALRQGPVVCFENMF